MITPAQIGAARALLGIDQKQLAKMSGVSVPTIQRMEASEGNVRGVIDTLTKADAACASGTRPHHPAITPPDQRQELRDGDRRPRADDPAA